MQDYIRINLNTMPPELRASVLDHYEKETRREVLATIDKMAAWLRGQDKSKSAWAMLLESEKVASASEIAHHYGMGVRAFNKLLHELGIQFHFNGKWNLHAEHQGKGYTSDLTFQLQRSNGNHLTKTRMAWTQVGRLFLYHTLCRHGIRPLAE